MKKRKRGLKKGVKRLIVLIFSIVIILGLAISYIVITENKKNDIKSNITGYIDELNELISNNTVLKYDGEYKVYKNTLLSTTEGSNSIIVNYETDGIKLGSTLKISNNKVESATLYVSKYILSYDGKNLSIKKGSTNSSKIVEENISMLEGRKTIASIDYDIIEQQDKSDTLKKRLENIKSNIVYSSGEKIYYNPIKGTICTEEKGDCLLFNVISVDTLESTTLNIMLNKNIEIPGDDGLVAWYENTNKNSAGGSTAIVALDKATSNWVEKARLISYDEAANLGCTINKKSCPLFMYETIKGKTLNSEGTIIKGYWTSSARNNVTSAWYISSEGNIYSYTVNAANRYGLRPVISIKKSILK